MRGRMMVLTAAGTAAAVGTVAVYRAAIRPWYRTWGVEPGDRGRLLPGDELVGVPTGGDTRSITITAPAAAIWPWLVQMGYGRAGWYSYDELDMRGRSADGIVPEWQALEVGQVMPSWPGGGFEVAQVEPDHALVLFLDDQIVARQAETARPVTPDDAGLEPMPRGLAASAAIMRTQPERFRASWAFVLDPIDGERTRLIERVRVEYPEIETWDRITGPLFGMGVFLMMRRQMLGIRTRAERLIRGRPDDQVVVERPDQPIDPELVSA
jgi:hypothetical protein